MKKYQMAWVQVPANSSVFLGSTDTALLKWFLDELKKIAPNYEIRNELHDLNGNKTHVNIHKLNHKDFEILSWLLQQLLMMGWEPFSVAKGQFMSFETEVVYLRREIVEE